MTESRRAPFFSIVLSTYGRGQHIKPTIESALGQSFGDFELIVVGDGCSDDTEEAVRSFQTDRITWRNLAQNSGSQSFPNNEGILASSGRWVAYLGHDDIWAPDHLESLAGRIVSEQGLDFVVGGCIYYGPEGSDTYFVTGLFDTQDAPLRHFFPPTSFAHRSDVTERVGPWRDPRAITAPVDCEFLLRAARAGLRFVSTNRITVHKFAAGHRYLSYLRVDSDEQREILCSLRKHPGIDTDSLVQKAKASGGYMALQYPDFSGSRAGHFFELNRQNKGISRPPLQPLRGRVVIDQTGDPRGLDWYGLELQARPYRWSGPNPRPKILISFTGERARVSIGVFGKAPDEKLEAVSVFVEAQRVPSAVENREEGESRLIADIPLKPDDYTVLTLNTPMFRPSDNGNSEDGRLLGIAVTDLVIEPI